jgi:hypothetical protein
MASEIQKIQVPQRRTLEEMKIYPRKIAKPQEHGYVEREKQEALKQVQMMASEIQKIQVPQRRTLEELKIYPRKSAKRQDVVGTGKTRSTKAGTRAT